MNEQDALIDEFKKLLTDRFLNKLAIAVRVIGDEENRAVIERFVSKIYALAGQPLPNLEPYIEHKHASDDELHFESLLMRGFL